MHVNMYQPGTVVECTRAHVVQLVRMVIEAPGWAGFFCAPREMIVQRVCKTDEVRRSAPGAALPSACSCNSLHVRPCAGVPCSASTPHAGQAATTVQSSASPPEFIRECHNRVLGVSSQQDGL